jgi:hypothetical protein
VFTYIDDLEHLLKRLMAKLRRRRPGMMMIRMAVASRRCVRLPEVATKVIIEQPE